MHCSILAIELTNVCNLSCSHCFQAYSNLEPQYMSFDVFRRCVEYADGYTELNWRGEPLLHPQLVDFVRYAKRAKKLNLGMHTNGLLLTSQVFSQLVDSGLDWLHISLHSLESCQKYLEALEWNLKLSSPIALYAEVDTTQEELVAISCGLEGKYRKDHIANWAGLLTDYRKVNSDPVNHASRCMWLKDNKVIAACDGRINACCWDFQLRHCIGHVDSFERISHNDVYELCESCIWMDTSKPADVYAQPHLVEPYLNHNIVLYNNIYYGCPFELGPLDLINDDQRRSSGLILGETLDHVKFLIDKYMGI